MNRHLKHRLQLLAVVDIPFGGRVASAQESHARDTALVYTELGKPVEREMKAAAVHRNGAVLGTGQFLHAVFDERGIDVVVTLFDPGGRMIARLTSRSDRKVRSLSSSRQRLPARIAWR